MSRRRETIYLGQAQKGFGQRLQQNRLLSGQQIAARAFKAAAEMESTWQTCVATMPLWRRLWLALLIATGRWGRAAGSGTAMAGEENASCPKA